MLKTQHIKHQNHLKWKCRNVISECNLKWIEHNLQNPKHVIANVIHLDVWVASYELLVWVASTCTSISKLAKYFDPTNLSITTHLYKRKNIQLNEIVQKCEWKQQSEQVDTTDTWLSKWHIQMLLWLISLSLITTKWNNTLNHIIVYSSCVINIQLIKCSSRITNKNMNHEAHH